MGRAKGQMEEVAMDEFSAQLDVWVCAKHALLAVVTEQDLA